MYILEDMINLGLKENQTFPSEEHKKVAMTLGLCNPRIKTRDNLTAVVQAVCKVPIERIQTITLAEIIEEFDCPNFYY